MTQMSIQVSQYLEANSIIEVYIFVNDFKYS